MANATLRTLVTGYGAQDPAIIDSLVNASGILQTALVQPASHNAWHVGKKVSALPSGTFINPGGSVTDQTVEDEIVQTDLKLCRAMQSDPIEIVNSYPGGIGAYYKNQSAGFMEGFGQTIAKQIIYGTNSTHGGVAGFRGFHQIAKDNGKRIVGSGTTGSRTTIFAVRWKQDVCSILVNGQHMSMGQFIQFMYLNNAQPIAEVTNTTTGAKKLVYQTAYDSYMSLLAMDSKNISAYINLQDDTNDRPTAANMDLLLDYVNADPANTFIYANRTARRMLWMLKDTKMQTVAGDNSYRTAFDMWNGIPVILDENILSTETNVLD